MANTNITPLASTVATTIIDHVDPYPLALQMRGTAITAAQAADHIGTTEGNIMGEIEAAVVQVLVRYDPSSLPLLNLAD